jgi:ribosomal 50S subunit-recycling heat shock protein
MRLDLFLKLSRLCPRRTVAQKLCDAGLVLINGRPAKSAHAVNLGDIINLKRRDSEIECRVLAVPAGRNLAKRDAGNLIEVISEKHFEPLGP